MLIDLKQEFVITTNLIEVSRIYNYNLGRSKMRIQIMKAVSTR